MGILSADEFLLFTEKFKNVILSINKGRFLRKMPGIRAVLRIKNTGENTCLFA